MRGLGMVLFLLTVSKVNSECFENEKYDDVETCVPEPRFAAKMKHRAVSSTSTCGSPPSEYCRVKPLNGCFKCNASSPTERHPIEYIADKSPGSDATFWQSETWWDWYQKNPRDDLKVNVSISFNKTYDITGHIMFTFESPRPSKAILEKSFDKGQTWDPLQYYSFNCRKDFGMENTDPTENRFGDFSAKCTEKYSSSSPQQNGKVTFDFLRRYNKASFFDTQVQQYLSATDLRLRMEYPGTDGLEVAKDEVTLKQYYYAVSDLEVIARCKCHGHARWCDFPHETGKNCDCLHNTTGDDCERCLPLFNNKTWMPATSETEPNPCERCECHSHADSCTYSQQEGYGTCDDCYHNTEGHFCERCKDKFYRNMSLSLNHPEICPDCNCFPQGITNNGTCNQTTGQCECRANVTGRQCDSCADTFWGYTLEPIGYCTECLCVGNGTVNASLNCDQYNGQCSCKPNVHTRTCQECKHGYWDFPKTLDTDCKRCDCDYGGSVLQICNKTTGSCMCRTNIIGTRCTDVTTGYFTPSFSYLTFEAEEATGDYMQASNTVDLDKFFTGTGYGRITPGQYINFQARVDVNWKWFLMLRYTDLATGADSLQIHISAEAAGNCSGVNMTVMNVTGLLAGRGLARRAATPIVMCPGQTYNFNVTFSPGSSLNASIGVDSLVILPDVTESRVYKVAVAEGVAHGFDSDTIKQCWNNWTTISTIATSQPICSKNISFSVMSEVFNGAMACGCDSVGTYLNSTCDRYGGKCQCKPGVTGRTCDKCKPGFYNFTSSGCAPCDCVSTGSHHLVCNAVSGQCPCKPGVITRTCSRCNDSFYGYTTGSGCVECRCNMSGSADAQCDDVTGNCTCKNSTDGAKCAECRFGFYNFTSAGCQACDCHEGGSQSQQCNLQTGICTCKSNALGEKCESCRPGTYHSDPNNPDGCTPCYCFGRSNTCTSASGFVRSYIKVDLGSPFSIDWTFVQRDVSMARVSQGRNFSFVTSGNMTLGTKVNFTENQLNSYGELLEMKLKYSSQGPLNVKMFWELEKTNGGIVRFDVKPTPSPEVTSYYVRLHEANGIWKTEPNRRNASDLQELLSDLMSITLNAQFMSNGSVLLSEIKLHSASQGIVGEKAGHVENCTCESGNYTGLSCELCNQGFTRNRPNNSYSACSLCRCTGRSLDCDGETGQCKGCRLGSQGLYCQQCQPGVDNTTDCTQCLPEYWGLKEGSNGCQDCDCVLPNTLYGNSTVCNATTGQCTCKEKISGRTCDRCHENAYNTSDRGCVECPECFRQLQEHVFKLRDGIKDLQGLILRVKNGDIGDITFAQSLAAANVSVEAISSNAKNSSGIEGTLHQELLKLNDTLKELERVLKGRVTSELTSLEGVTMTTQQERVQIQDHIRLTEGLVRSGYGVVTSTMQAAVDQANATDTYLKELVPRFTSQASMATNQSARQNGTGNDITSKTSSAGALVTSADVTSLEAGLRQNMTSQLLVALEQQAQSVRRLATETNATAHALYANVTAVLDGASRALQAANGLGPDNAAAVLSVKRAADDAKANASSAVQRVSNLTKQYAGIVAETETAVRNTEATLAAVKERENAGIEMLAEAKRALAEAEAAVATAANAHRDALEMRQILLTFEAKANESQQLAARALASAREANQTSLRAIAYTREINASIQATLVIASQGLNMATEALRLASGEHQGVLNIHASATILKRESDMSPYTSDYHARTRLNATQTATNNKQAIDACAKNYSTLSIQAKPAGEEALTSAQQASGAITTSRRSVDKVMNDVPRLQTVNTTRLNELKVEIQRLRTEFTATDVKTINAQLRVAKDQQQEFIDRYKRQVLDLRKQVEEIKSLQRSLGVPPRGCS
ncbi:laminin subunit gamma-1 [Nematostella vectensis]|uniref:laminin subunit gamma-1 n=1 Tax=Nematostella vectensis TaxID=45351 RepID=UPI00207718FB|nr:laminin subunit gamma-1 [Nematostella vectensis]